METLRPIEIGLRLEIVPLDAVTEVAKVPMKLTPAVAREFPSRRLGESATISLGYLKRLW